MNDKKMIKKTWKGEVYTFEFVGGKVLECDYNALNDNMKNNIISLGFKKVWDSFSKPMSGDEAYECGLATWESLLMGDWNRKKAGGGKDTVLLQAMLHIGKLQDDQIREVFNGLDKDGKAALMKRADILQAVADIAAERAATMATIAEKAPVDTPIGF